MNGSPPHLLLAAHDAGDARSLIEMLAEEATAPYRLSHAATLGEAHHLLRQGDVSVMLLDLTLPGAGGLEGITSTLLLAPDVAVVALSSREDDKLAMQAMHAGAQDYLVKGQLDARTLVRSVRYALERRRRREVQQFLSEAGQVLASSLELEETLQRIPRLAVPMLADWAVLYLREAERGMPRLTAAHRDAAAEPLLAALSRYAAEPVRAHPALRVVDAGESVLVPEVPDSLMHEVAHGEEHERLIRELAPRSLMMVPLQARGRVFGALGLFASDAGRRYGAEHLALAEELGRRAALALENAYRYRREHEALQRAERAVERMQQLQSITAALSGAATPAEVVEVVLQRGLRAVGACNGLICLLGSDGTALETMYGVGLPRELLAAWERVSLEMNIPTVAALRRRQPVLVTSREELLRDYPEFAEVLLAFHDASAVAVPLLVEGRALGVLTVGFAAWGALEDLDTAFLLAMAEQCAQALERARLFESERQAHAAATRATQVRDEVVGFVAHDLRNPLGSVMLLSSLLLDDRLGETERRRCVEDILRSSHQMEYLIQDLLEISRIEAGRLRVEPCERSAVALVEEALAMIVPTAATRGLQLRAQLPDEPPAVSADGPRVLQVLSNLLDNAVKFTPDGGEIRLRVQARRGEVVFSVSDSGPGIAPEHLPHLFDRFWQAKRSGHGGTGLGLAIAKGIVEAHGGRIWAECEPGVGARFLFTLPAPAPTPGAAPPPLLRGRAAAAP